MSIQSITFNTWPGPLSRHQADALREEAAMTSPHDVPTPGTREHFCQVTTLQRWGTIQEYVELCVRREAHW